jgi:hypothetical protein
LTKINERVRKESHVKRGAPIAAAIVVAFSMFGPPPTAFGAAMPSTSSHDRETNRHGHHGLVHATVRPTAQSDESRERSAADRAAMHDNRFLGMNAKIEKPSAEWDCNGGDAGCSWEPPGWRRPDN